MLWFVREDILPEGQIGGMGLHAWNLAREMCDHYDITVIGASGSKDGAFFLIGRGKCEQLDFKDWKPAAGKFRYLRLFNENLYHLNERDDLLQDWVYPQTLLKNWSLWLKDDQFDFIHLHDVHFWDAADVLRKYYNCPIVVTCHLSTAISYPDFPQVRYWRYLVNRESVAYFHADYLLTCSRFYANQLHSEFGLHNKEIVVFYNAVRLKDFESIPDTLRSKFDCEKLVVFVGRLDRMKGIELLLSLPEQFPTWHFVMVSRHAMTDHDSGLADEVEEFTRNHDNFEWVVQGSDEEKLQYMKAADVMVMPSIAEPFGIVALEAHAIGTPLVVSNYAGLSEFNSDENSWMFSVVQVSGEVDMAATSRNLIVALKNFKYDKGRIARGYRTAAHFSWERTASVHHELYGRVLREKGQINCR